MSDNKFTPGPWEFVSKLSASENHHGYFILAQKQSLDGKWSLALVQPGDEDGTLGRANATLIAAAPAPTRRDWTGWRTRTTPSGTSSCPRCAW